RHLPADFVRHAVRFHRARRHRHLTHALLRDHLARDVGHVCHVLLRLIPAAPVLHDLATFLRNQLAGRVRNLLHLLLAHHLAAAAGHDLAVLLGDHLAGGVADWLHDRVWHNLANRVRDDLANLLADVVAGADGADFFLRAPDLLASPLARTLHLVRHSRAGAVVAPAGARVEDALAGRLAALGHDRPGAVGPFLFPCTRLHGDALFGPDRLARITLADALAGLRLGSIARLRNLLGVLLVNGLVGAVVLRHLVLFPDRLLYGVAALAQVLLVDRRASGVVLRHLVFLPHGVLDYVAAFPHVVLIHRPASGVVLR